MTLTPIQFYNMLLKLSNTELSMIQPYISISYKLVNKSENWIEITTNRNNFFTDFSLYISGFKVSKTDSTTNFIEATIEYMVDLRNFSEGVFLLISDPNKIYKISFGSFINGQVYEQSFIVSQIFSNIQFSENFIKISATYNSQLQTYLNINNTVILGKNLRDEIDFTKTDEPYYRLKTILNAVSKVLSPVHVFKFEYVPILDKISIEDVSNKIALFNITNTADIPIIKSMFDSLLNENISFNKLIEKLIHISPIFEDKIYFDFIDDKKIVVNLYNQKIFDEQKEPLVLEPTTQNHLVKSTSVINEPEYSSFGNDSIINTLTQEYKKNNNIEFYSTNVSNLTRREEGRLKLSQITNIDGSVLKSLQEAFPQINVDELKYIAKNVKLRPSLEWSISYGRISIEFNYPIIGLKIADLIELSGVIQAYSFSKNSDNKRTQFKGIYYVTSVFYQYAKETISTTVEASLVEFI